MCGVGFFGGFAHYEPLLGCLGFVGNVCLDVSGIGDKCIGD